MIWEQSTSKTQTNMQVFSTTSPAELWDNLPTNMLSILPRLYLPMSLRLRSLVRRQIQYRASFRSSYMALKKTVKPLDVFCQLMGCTYSIRGTTTSRRNTLTRTTLPDQDEKITSQPTLLQKDI